MQKKLFVSSDIGWLGIFQLFCFLEISRKQVFWKSTNLQVGVHSQLRDGAESCGKICGPSLSVCILIALLLPVGLHTVCGFSFPICDEYEVNWGKRSDDISLVISP